MPIKDDRHVNKFAIAMSSKDGSPRFYPLFNAWPLSADDALNFAAWLVAMAEPFATEKFADILEDVCGS